MTRRFAGSKRLPKRSSTDSLTLLEWHSGCIIVSPEDAERFDTARCVPHSRYIVILTRHLAALAAILALSVGNVAVCAGWQPTADARMACCMSDANCSMQKQEGHDHSSSSSGVSQTQADSCCAASTQRRESSPAASIFASSAVIALLPAVVISAPTTVPATHEWRPLAPLPVSTIPTHLLLSVLIV